VLAYLPSPSSGEIHIGPLALHAYGLLYAVAVVVAVLVCRRRWEQVGGKAELVDEVALWGFPAGLIGGRLYHVITSWNEVPHTWWGPFAVWKGGLGIWGGIFLGVLVGLWRVRRRGANVALFMDAGAPALLVAQAIGRIGNWFNQELFGKPTTLPWGLKIDPEHRPEQYANVAAFQPMFLYELIWNLALAAFLVWLGRRRKIRPPGIFALYVTGYSLFRIFAEVMRVDPAHHFFGLRLNLFVAIGLTIVGFVWFLRTQSAAGGSRSGSPGSGASSGSISAGTPIG
jgi:prolipoprotein diacylglyceryl transferase